MLVHSKSYTTIALQLSPLKKGKIIFEWKWRIGSGLKQWHFPPWLQASGRTQPKRKMNRLGRSSGNSWEEGRWWGSVELEELRAAWPSPNTSSGVGLPEFKSGLMPLIFCWDPENELNFVSHHFLINVVGKTTIPTWFITVQLITYRLSEI